MDDLTRQRSAGLFFEELARIRSVTTNPEIMGLFATAVDYNLNNRDAGQEVLRRFCTAIESSADPLARSSGPMLEAMATVAIQNGLGVRLEHEDGETPSMNRAISVAPHMATAGDIAAVQQYVQENIIRAMNPNPEGSVPAGAGGAAASAASGAGGGEDERAPPRLDGGEEDGEMGPPRIHEDAGAGGEGPEPGGVIFHHDEEELQREEEQRREEELRQEEERQREEERMREQEGKGI
ncbi:hypothetical protein PRK78_004364 [Emydomyces testavorans]|uniref:Uncharacterized protein n=1 Tax=Emydomyces testavorans TaxID=2070801 RepID=A0AAF0DK34_9EURO|nr:hypothetical protein PRK78_004364 [Emydomyces testavorans]